ncbi:hypothetical protein GWQ29_07010 [Aeromonas sp. 2HA2]|uniref:GTPase n=1 Tax=unclassified Aeromonas TaxID=257493 RepID=UPI0023DDA312|nr:GTPase [Aeromonas sp. 2HA2]MDF2409169.1 hypothetical protein [Aeromonas sp. 2HA2]
MKEEQLQVLFSRANNLLQQELGGSKPTIAAWGLMNAGKSYLLNMLTDHIQTECFRTRDVRETAELKQFETEQYIFLDTPGLDANQEDDFVAQQGAAKADIVLFVHQPQGELEKIEMDFLRALKESFGEYAEQNIIIILSKIDCEDREKINTIEKRILEQCQQDLGFQPDFFKISGTRFHKGVQKKEDNLVRASHIDDLKVHLNSIRGDYSAVKVSRQRQALDDIITEIEQCELAFRQTIVATKKTLAKEFDAFNNALTTLDVALENTRNYYRSIN